MKKYLVEVKTLPVEFSYEIEANSLKEAEELAKDDNDKFEMFSKFLETGEGYRLIKNTDSKVTPIYDN